MLPVNLVEGHCPGRAQCTVLDADPGRLVVLTCAMLTQLKDSRHARWRGDDSEVRVCLTMDHTCTGGPLSLEFLVMPICWRENPERIDPDLVVGVYLDPRSGGQ